MEKKIGEILPAKGVWTVEDLSNYLDLPPATVQQKLSDLGVGVVAFSSRYKHKLFRIEDLKTTRKEVDAGSQRIARKGISK